MSARSALRALRATLLVGMALGLGLWSGRNLILSAAAQARVPYASVEVFSRILHTIETRYVREVPAEELLHASVRGMMAELDPHSAWLDADTFQRLQQRTEGNFFGIGVELSPDPEGARVLRVVPRSPAAAAGLVVGDRIQSVGGQMVVGRPLSEVAALLEGERGSTVELGLGGRGGKRSARLTRDLVVDVAVEAELAPGGVALIRVAQFSRRAGAELDRALSDAALYGPSGPRALVLDLRDNPGGLMEEAVAMLDRLLGQGPLVETIGRAASANEVWASKDEPTDFQGPVVVLINGGSASAAEVVAGVLQDRKRAKLIGTRTYGKGSVQQLYELQDGSALKLTQARYRLPSGRFIEDRDGLVPEIPIALPGELPPAAVLEARIRALPIEEAERAVLLTELARLDGPAAAEAPVPREGSLEERLTHDAQLARALEEVASP